MPKRPASKTITVRLKPAQESLLRRAEAASGRSRSDIVREAIARYAGERVEEGGKTAYELLKPWIGAFSSGRGDLSVDTGEKFLATLRRKHARRGH